LTLSKSCLKNICALCIPALEMRPPLEAIASVSQFLPSCLIPGPLGSVFPLQTR
jgi:hypothetical protein